MAFPIYILGAQNTGRPALARLISARMGPHCVFEYNDLEPIRPPPIVPTPMFNTEPAREWGQYGGYSGRYYEDPAYLPPPFAPPPIHPLPFAPRRSMFSRTTWTYPFGYGKGFRFREGEPGPIIVVFDMCDRASFYRAMDWVRQFSLAFRGKSHCAVAVVGMNSRRPGRQVWRSEVIAAMPHLHVVPKIQGHTAVSVHTQMHDVAGAERVDWKTAFRLATPMNGVTNFFMIELDDDSVSELLRFLTRSEFI